MKNLSRNKFLLCFRPVVDMDIMRLEPKPAAAVVNRPAFTCVAGVQSKEDFSKPSTANSSVSDEENSIDVHSGGKKTLSKVIKAVVFETVLAHRVRDRKRNNESKNRVLTRKLIQSTTSSSSSSSSPLTPNTIQKTETKHQQSGCNESKPKQERIDKGFSCSKNRAMSLFLICLAMTIFWGKLVAIILTSIWLYFLHHNGVAVKMETIKTWGEKESEEEEEEEEEKVVINGSKNRERVLNFGG
ncbi:hypothetical protein E1A91_A01G017500v1 [Gossypium mustelinum]|uniref:Uncharacterized protein n=1 Tax=Gossypium mustelinum TaxID=34275 RepID=A0A5D3AC06_GOSMU|nr:hypothetical protein E1A91_A01G017500v1 [Gossypium mustelinum]